jgi:hypothetical protein
MTEAPGHITVIRSAALSFAAAWLVVGIAADTQDATVLGFDHEKAGAPPPGFVFAAMRQPAPGSWVVRRTGTAGYLAHETDATAQGYALAVYDGPPQRDVAVTVRLRLSGGRRLGGLVWHYTDHQHYFAAVLDLSRREISLYRIAGGNRIRMEIEGDLELDPDAWHTMKVAHTGRHVRVSLGGIRVLDDDRRGQDRPDTGRVGLIAAGDAHVWFDDLRIETPRN